MTVRQQPNSFRTGPDERGHFGLYGGRFVAETLMPLILDLEKAYAAAKADPEFKREMDGYLTHYVGRPSPLYFAERLTEHCGGAKIYFKRDELNHTGAHKVNNVLGQIMLAKRMSKPRMIAETGAALGTLQASGALEARYTVLSPADSLVDLAATSGAGHIGLNAPESARNRRNVFCECGRISAEPHSATWRLISSGCRTRH